MIKDTINYPRTVRLQASIIINNYNYAMYLDRAICSALNQSYSDTQMVVVDDGSTDDSREVVSSYGGKVVPLFKDNGGQASAMNAGFRRSSGDLVVFLDADDVLYPFSIQRAVDVWQREPFGVMQTRLDVINEAGEALGMLHPQETLCPDPVAQMSRLGDYLYPPTSGNVFSRCVLEKIMPIPEEKFRICADTYLCIKAPFYGRHHLDNRQIAQYRIHGKNNFQMRGKRAEHQSGKRKHYIRTTENMFIIQELVKTTARSLQIPVSPRLICGNITSLYRWIYCKKIYNYHFSGHPASSLRILSWIVIAMGIDSRIPWRVKVSLLIKALFLFALPRPLVNHLVNS